MKKTFTLNHPKIKRPRLIEGVKHEIRKYIKRERKRELPKGADFWDFACKYGDTEEVAEKVHMAELDKHIDDADKRELESFYIEVLRKKGHRTKKPKTFRAKKTIFDDDQHKD